MVIDDQWSYLTMLGILEVVFRSASFPSCWFGLVEDKVIRLLKHNRLDSKKRSTRDDIQIVLDWTPIDKPKKKDKVGQVTPPLPFLIKGVEGWGTKNLTSEEMIQKDWVYDVTKAKTFLGSEPRVSLSEGANLTFEWYKKEKCL